MSGVTWSKFFWSDWQSDDSLRLCSLAAQGLWMRMLCIAASHDPTGYVCVAGRPLGVTDLARLTGASETQVASLLAELDQNGVCSRDGKGRRFSRRMVRDARRAAQARKQGKEGGNPDIRRGAVPKERRVRPYRRSDNAAKTRRIFDRGGGKCHWCKVDLDWSDAGLLPNSFQVDHLVAVCDGGTNDEANLVSACASCNHARSRKDWINQPDTNPMGGSDVKPHKPEASIPEKERLDANASLSPLGDGKIANLAFEEVWRAYPHVRGRSAKPKTLAAWRKLSAADRECLPGAIRQYAAEGREPNNEAGAPAMQRWLTERRFDDWREDSAEAPVSRLKRTPEQQAAHDAYIASLLAEEDRRRVEYPATA